jgi:5-methylcytosine-specific restriction endonuclease McrA
MARVVESGFDQATILAVWRKGRVIDGYDSAVWRWDMCGSVMKYDQYGTETKHGWEVDHVYPRARGGSDDLSNLQPLYWQNNRRKGDTYPWSCT